MEKAYSYRFYPTQEQESVTRLDWSVLACSIS
ncbi:MAG: helix-turn-helix domain-containing protein, partial [Desertifilum sp. SIO1I2]|nr:helix-turn-helix domain-containing protein [Desertifilum sp. SIO1I2]